MSDACSKLVEIGKSCPGFIFGRVYKFQNSQWLLDFIGNTMIDRLTSEFGDNIGRITQPQTKCDPYKVVPPQLQVGLQSPLTIDITPIKPRYWSFARFFILRYHLVI